jgi:hypothetical protein
MQPGARTQPDTVTEIASSLVLMREIREALQFANENPGGGISDTLWMLHRPQTVFDALDEAIDSLESPCANAIDWEAIDRRLDQATQFLGWNRAQHAIRAIVRDVACLAAGHSISQGDIPPAERSTSDAASTGVHGGSSSGTREPLSPHERYMP